MDNPECPQCGGPGVPLGVWCGKLACRCRNCGWDFRADLPPADDEDDEDGEE